MELPRSRSGLVKCLSSAGLALACCLAGTASAQWPTSYLTPRILTSGINIRAGSVLALADGGVVACYDTGTTQIKTLVSPRFDSAGNMTQPGTQIAPYDAFCEKAQLLFPEQPNSAYSLFSQHVPSTYYAPYRYSNQIINNDGHWGLRYYTTDWRFEAATHMPDGSNFGAAFDPGARKVYTLTKYYSNPTPVALTDAFARDFSLLPIGMSKALVAYEQFSDQAGIPSKVWTYTAENSGSAVNTAALFPAEPVGPESQFMPRMAALTGGNSMLAWLGSSQDTQSLFCKVIDSLGANAAIPRQVMSNVENYVVTSSTLGVPIFGAVQRNKATVPPVDTLLAGLVDPGTGGLLALPLATGLGIQTKFVRQEADGNVSLVYSIPEGETTLLKVRRISGASGATLWETTVADLGIPNDALLQRYPNTYVSGNQAGVLYILARFDQPYSASSSFQLVRLRADGHMGKDPLVAPENVTVTPTGSSTARIDWTDTNTAETHYIVARTETDFSGYHILGAVPTDGTTFTDGTVSPGVQYHYIVAAYDAATGEFVLSPEIPYMFEVT